MKKEKSKAWLEKKKDPKCKTTAGNAGAAAGGTSRKKGRASKLALPKSFRTALVTKK